MSTIDARKKRGRPPVDSQEVSVRMERRLIEAVDEWRDGQPDALTRPEAVRRILTRFLEAFLSKG